MNAIPRILAALVPFLLFVLAGCPWPPSDSGSTCGGGATSTGSTSTSSTSSTAPACVYPEPSDWTADPFTVGAEGCAPSGVPGLWTCSADCASAAAGREWSCTQIGQPGACCACLYREPAPHDAGTPDANDTGDASACVPVGTMIAVPEEDSVCPSDVAHAYVCADNQHCDPCAGLACVPARGPQIACPGDLTRTCCVPDLTDPSGCTQPNEKNASAWCCVGQVIP